MASSSFAVWNFLEYFFFHQLFSVPSWLNPQMQNPWEWRADCNGKRGSIRISLSGATPSSLGVPWARSHVRDLHTRLFSYNLQPAHKGLNCSLHTKALKIFFVCPLHTLNINTPNFILSSSQTIRMLTFEPHCFYCIMV